MRRLAGSSVFMLGLAACGSSGDGGGGGDYVELSNTTSVEVGALQFLAISNTGAQSSGDAGSLDYDQNEVTGGRLAGDINADRTEIALDGGGVATLTNPAGTEYLRVFSTEGAGDPIFGVVGIATASADLPDSGSSTYQGIVNLQVADGNVTQALTGDAAITASWSGSGSVQSTFSDFEGVANAQAVPGSITINNASISGNGFSGGSVSTTGTAFDLTGSADISGTGGQFYGPGADEVGGTLVIDDVDRKIIGVFSGD